MFLANVQESLDALVVKSQKERDVKLIAYKEFEDKNCVTSGK